METLEGLLTPSLLTSTRPTLEVRNWKSVGSKKSKVRSKKLKVGSNKSKVRGRKLEVES